MAEIIKCPHCGYEKAKITEKRCGSLRHTGDMFRVCHTSDIFQVICDRCKARGPVVTVKYDLKVSHNGQYRYTLANSVTREEAKAKAVELWNTRHVDGETSDGYHTFNELYHHRAVLFSVIVKAFQEKAWKARLHHDGTMYDGMFIVGIDTPYGQVSYYYDIDPYWHMFECRELERAPEWDGHTLAIERIGKLEPVRHGKWVWNNDAIDYGIGAWVCSECLGRNENIHAGKPGTIEGFGTNPYIWAGSQFCPYCGAKMDVEVEG